MGRSSSLRVGASVTLALLLPACSLLVGLDGLSGTSPGGGDGGVVEGAEAGDAHPVPDAQDAPGDDATNGDVEVADVATEVGGESGGAEAGPPSYAATVLSDAPIAYWRLDDTTTTAKDFSGNGHDGSYEGSVKLGVPGAIANDPDTAVQFDGSTAQMVATVPSSFEFPGNAPYSLEAWVEPASNPAGMAVLGKNTYSAGAGGYQGWYLAYTSNGYLDNWRNNDETGNPGPAPGVFVHVVATYDGTTLALYVNGQLFSTYASSTALVATGAPFTAGGISNWGMFTGVLDEIAIYDKVLPKARVAAHYAVGTGQ